jgi:phosphatidylinositol 4-kinase B
MNKIISLKLPTSSTSSSSPSSIPPTNTTSIAILPDPTTPTSATTTTTITTTTTTTTTTAATTPAASTSSWLLRFFESKHFDMSICISYLFNTKEPGVQTYLCNRLFTLPSDEVDFYLPQLLNIYIYCSNNVSNEHLMADLLNNYFRSRCSDRVKGVDFSLRCSWLLDAYINDNARLATTNSTNKTENRIRRGLNNAIKLYRLIISEKLRPNIPSSKTNNNSTTVKEEDGCIIDNKQLNLKYNHLFVYLIDNLNSCIFVFLYLR